MTKVFYIINYKTHHHDTKEHNYLDISTLEYHWEVLALQLLPSPKNQQDQYLHSQLDHKTFSFVVT